MQRASLNRANRALENNKNKISTTAHPDFDQLASSRSQSVDMLEEIIPETAIDKLSKLHNSEDYYANFDYNCKDLNCYGALHLALVHDQEKIFFYLVGEDKSHRILGKTVVL